MAATIAVAVTMAIATVATTATAVSAMSTAMMLLALLDEVVDFLLGSGAVLDDASLEMEILACERMVHIHRHRVVVHRDDIAKIALTVLVGQGDNCASKDIGLVKDTIGREHLLGERGTPFGVVLAIGLGMGKDKIIIDPRHKLCQTGLERGKEHTYLCINREGLVLGDLLFEHFLTILLNVQLIGCGYKTM